MQKVGPKGILLGIGVVIVAVVVISLISGFMGYCDNQDWQIVQSLKGKITVNDDSGWYDKWWSKVWTYPRAHTAIYNDEAGEGEKQIESIRVTFNDGGTAQISSMVRFLLPSSEEDRRRMHREFSGDIENVVMAVKSHLITCCKAAAPLMSASEHQSARKAEYQQTVERMLRNGLYKMRKIAVEKKDQTDETGEATTVYVTEIVLDDDGMEIIDQPSPLEEYNIQILQFSITETEYNPQTLEQFEAKLKSNLAAEQSKAEREQEVQERLMVIERGNREVAEIEAEANKRKMKEVTEGKMRAEVALQAKIQAETEANQKLEVARIKKDEAETEANQKLEVAKLNALAAEENAKAIRTLAAAEEDRIKKAGAITEQQRVLAEIAAKRDVEIAQGLSKVNVPRVMVIGGGGENGETGSMRDTLMNLYLMDRMKVLDPAVVDVKLVD
jgi:hypothetical protein